MRSLRRLFMLIGIAVTVYAVIQELRKPREEREWHGTVGGVVPYEFRVPTGDRLRGTYWEPTDERVFTPTAFGVGWGVNLGRVVEMAKARSAA